MSKRTNSHTISHAEDIFSGDAYIGGADGRGIPRASLVQVDLGTPTIADVNGIAAQDSGAGGPFPFDLTLDGALASGGVATFDVPRGVQIVSATGAGTAVFVFYGTDKYGVLIQESLTANGQTVVFGKKAFKTVTRVSVSKDTDTSFNVGDSDILGLPFRLENVADILVINENDQNKVQVAGVTAAAVALTAAAVSQTMVASEVQGSQSTIAAASASVPSPTAIARLVTYTSNDPSPANPQTINDGNAITDAEITIALLGLETFSVEVAADIAAIKVEVDKLVLESDDEKVQTDKLVLESADYKVAIDQGVVDLAAYKVEIDKLVVDMAAQKVELDKLIGDLSAVDSGTLVKADATVTATATTGDVRGTYNPTMTLDGSKALKLTYKPKGRNTANAYGSVQFRA